jgi:hypothetical protein
VRIVVWNAHQAFGRKQGALRELRPDVAVIPECASDIGAPADHWNWVGENRQKGLGVVSYGDYRAALDGPYDPAIHFAAPITITGPHPFFLLAIWAQRPYREPVYRALENYSRRLTDRPSVVAGDFNQNAIWDRPNRAHNHSRNVALMKDLGLVSAYHHHFGVAQGNEPDATHFFRYRTDVESRFHIDYCFVPTAWLNRVVSVEVGKPAGWISNRLSDHVPLVVELQMPRVTGL